MQRNEFIKQCGFACLGTLGLSAIVAGCATTRGLHAPVKDNRLVVPLNAFLIKTKEGSGSHRRYVVVRNEQLNYPLVVYRDSEASYTALLLRCSHQYNELNINGELLTCTAHGSEFDTKGNVVNGPAEDRLRSFPTLLDNQHLYILLS